ncbi:MAG TPA: hypothetical protein VHV53_08930 [Solirubrobacterales bacterium]|nr:hypothetical protein [Solirubrobacterales bacterium]
MIVSLAALVWASGAGAAPAVTGAFELGNKIGVNNKIVEGPDGNMWFTIGEELVGKITPSGQVTEYEISGLKNPVGIAPGPDGNLWVPTKEAVTKFSPADPEGTAHEFVLNEIGEEGQIVEGPDKLMWVASENKVIHFSTADPEGTEQKVALAGELDPKDIDVAGSLVAIADNHGGGRVVTFTTTGVQKDFAIPGGSQGLAGAPGGQIGFSAAGAMPEQAGLITPASSTLAQSFELLGDPFGVAYGSDQAFWIVRFGAGELTRVTSSATVSSLAGLPKESCRQIAAGPENTLWVTCGFKEHVVEESEIVRVSGLEPPSTTTTTTTGAPAPPSTVKPIPNTKIRKGPKKVVRTAKATATVRFAFSSTIPRSAFQCKLTKLSARGKKATPSRATFATCRSPKVLHLAPGSYRFAVRAVSAEVADPTPAERSFRVVRKSRHR